MKTRARRSNQAQQNFFKQPTKLEFGGELMKQACNRHARPISSKDPLHLILKSSHAKGAQSFGHSKHLAKVRLTIENHCVKYGVKLIKWSNNFNHLHLFVKFPSREIYLRFIRTLTARLAMLVTSAKKQSSLQSTLGFKKFWDYRPFTRVVRGLKPYNIVIKYIRLNQLEAEGVIPKRSGRLLEVTEAEWKLFA